jgi:uncharacterized membrane protein YfcA
MFSLNDTFGFIVLFIASSISSAAGIGGGLLNMAILQSIFQYSLNDAKVYSLSCILGNTLLQVLINSQKRHPNDNSKPIVHWNLLLVLLPAEISGSNLGVLLSNSFSLSFHYLLTIIILIFALIISSKKCFYLFEMENNRFNNNININQSSLGINEIEGSYISRNSQLNEPLHIESMNSNGSSFVASLTGAGIVDVSEDSLTIINESIPKLILPWNQIIIVLFMWSLFIMGFITSSMYDTCSILTLIILLILYVFLTIQVLLSISYLNKYQLDNLSSSSYCNDIDWTSNYCYSIPFISFIIGTLTSILGFGGGELMGPYLLSLKVLPIVSTSTSGMLSYLNTFSNVIHFGLLGKVVSINKTIYFFLIGIFGGLCGRLFALWGAKEFGRSSIFVFALIIVLFVSTIMYIYYLLSQEIDFYFSPYC